MDKDNSHIAIVIDSMNGGGAELSCLTIVRALLKRKIRVDLVLLEYRGPRLLEIPDGVRLFVLDRNFQQNKSNERCSIPSDKIRWINYPFKVKEYFCLMPRYLKSLRCSNSFLLRPRLRHFYWSASMARYIKMEQPDLIYANLFHSGVISLLGRHISLCKVPVVWAVRNNIYHSFSRKNLKYCKNLIPNADRVHAVSNGVAELVTEFAPEVKDKITTILNPVDTRIISLTSRHIEHPWLPRESSKPSTVFPKVLLAAGRLIKQKNFTMLIQALAIVRANRDVRLVLLGDGPERRDIEDLTRKLNVNDAVSMPGWVENPYAFMARVDLFVMSSSFEGLPGVLIQALACGCPVVSTDCPYGPSEILEGGRWGRLVPVDNHIELANAISVSLNEQSNPDILQKRAMYFSPDLLIQHYINMFNSTLTESGIENQD